MFFSHRIILFFNVLVVGFFAAGCAHVLNTHSIAAPQKQANVPMLLYHRIGELPSGASNTQKRWTLSPKKFDGQMRWIAEHGFCPITAAQLSDYSKRGLPLPAHSIVISFDDGWKDQYDVAFPILKKYGFPATFFIIVDSVGHSAYMNWQQISALSDSGMDIESHSRTHPRLSVASSQEAWREIDGSKRILESHLHKPVTVFAYPFGSYDDEVISLVQEAGFDTAVTLTGLNGGYLFRVDQSYVLPRYAVESTDDLDDIGRLKIKRGPVCPALFVSLVQDPPIFSSGEGIDALIDFASQTGIKTLFVQVYRENKTWFPSKIADDSPYKKNYKDLSEDPFARIISKAHQQGIQVHAWLNLLSLSQNQDSKFLKKYGTDVLTRNLKNKKKLSDYLIDAQYFLEPGDPRVREDLSKTVAELLQAYPDLDGIQFDYIRYPDMEPHYGYTPINIERFKKATGLKAIDEESPVWKDWKRAQVTELLTILVKTARTLRPKGFEVSVTGCMPYARAYYEAYQDWPSWVTGGLIDFVTIMDYSADPAEFKRWLSVVKEKVPDFSKVRIGIGAYKLLESPKIFEQESCCIEALGMSGAIFHYGSLLESPKLRSIVIRENKGGLPCQKQK